MSRFQKTIQVARAVTELLDEFASAPPKPSGDSWTLPITIFARKVRGTIYVSPAVPPMESAGGVVSGFKVPSMALMILSGLEAWAGLEDDGPPVELVLTASKPKKTKDSAK